MRNAFLLFHVLMFWQFIPCFSQYNWALDPSFGINGVAHHNFYPPTNLDQEEIIKIVLQPDGKIVSVTVANLKEIILVRYLQDGSIDNHFGVNGRVAISPGDSNNYPIGFEVQQDGKLILTGRAIFQDCSAYYFITRFLSNGELDVAYVGNTSNGVRKIENHVFQDYRALLVMSDNSVLLGGGLDLSVSNHNINFSLLKLSSELTGTGTGWMNSNLKNVDISVMNHDVIDKLVEGSNKCVYAVGTTRKKNQINASEQTLTIAKIDATGELVSAFGENGILYNEEETMVYPKAAAVSGDDGLIIIGWVNDALEQGLSGYEVRKYLPNGELDLSFATNGKHKLKLFATNPNMPSDHYTSMLIQKDGKILLAGQTKVPYPEILSCLLVRLNENGTLDSTFGEKGKLIIGLGVSGYINSMMFDITGNKIIAGGTSYYYTHSLLIKYLNDFNVGMPEFALIQKDWKVYPNPINASSKVELSLKEAEYLAMDLYDSQGRLIFTYNNPNKEKAGLLERELILPADLNAGVYRLNIRYGSVNQTLSLVKE